VIDGGATGDEEERELLVGDGTIGDEEEGEELPVDDDIDTGVIFEKVGELFEGTKIGFENSDIESYT